MIKFFKPNTRTGGMVTQDVKVSSLGTLKSLAWMILREDGEVIIRAWVKNSRSMEFDFNSVFVAQNGRITDKRMVDLRRAYDRPVEGGPAKGGSLNDIVDFLNDEAAKLGLVVLTENIELLEDDKDSGMVSLRYKIL